MQRNGANACTVTRDGQMTTTRSAGKNRAFSSPAASLRRYAMEPAGPVLAALLAADVLDVDAVMKCLNSDGLAGLLHGEHALASSRAAQLLISLPDRALATLPSTDAAAAAFSAGAFYGGLCHALLWDAICATRRAHSGAGGDATPLYRERLYAITTKLVAVGHASTLGAALADVCLWSVLLASGALHEPTALAARLLHGLMFGGDGLVDAAAGRGRESQPAAAAGDAAGDGDDASHRERASRTLWSGCCLWQSAAVGNEVTIAASAGVGAMALGTAAAAPVCAACGALRLCARDNLDAASAVAGAAAPACRVAESVAAAARWCSTMLVAASNGDPACPPLGARGATTGVGDAASSRTVTLLAAAVARSCTVLRYASALSPPGLSVLTPSLITVLQTALGATTSGDAGDSTAPDALLSSVSDALAARLSSLLTLLFGSPVASAGASPVAGAAAQPCLTPTALCLRDELLANRDWPSYVQRATFEWLLPGSDGGEADAATFAARIPLVQWVQQWSHPAFVSSTKTGVQVALTRVLLLALQRAPPALLSIVVAPGTGARTGEDVAALSASFATPVFVALTAGIQLRMDHPSHAIRGCGLAVAQRFSERLRLTEAPVAASHDSSAASAAARTILPGEPPVDSEQLAVAPDTTPLSFAGDPDMALLEQYNTAAAAAFANESAEVRARVLNAASRVFAATATAAACIGGAAGTVVEGALPLAASGAMAAPNEQAPVQPQASSFVGSGVVMTSTRVPPRSRAQLLAMEEEEDDAERDAVPAAAAEAASSTTAAATSSFASAATATEATHAAAPSARRRVMIDVRQYVRTGYAVVSAHVPPPTSSAAPTAVPPVVVLPSPPRPAPARSNFIGPEGSSVVKVRMPGFKRRHAAARQTGGPSQLADVATVSALVVPTAVASATTGSGPVQLQLLPAAAATAAAAESPIVAAARKLAARAPRTLTEAVEGLKRASTADAGGSTSGAVDIGLPAVPGLSDQGPAAGTPFEAHVATLCTLAGLIRHAADRAHLAPSLELHGPLLLRSTLALSNTFNMPDFPVWRFTALVALASCGAPFIVPALLSLLFGSEQSEGSRLELLDVLVASARELADLEKPVIPEAPWVGAIRDWEQEQQLKTAHTQPVASSKPRVDAAAARKQQQGVIKRGFLLPKPDSDDGAASAKAAGTGGSSSAPAMTQADLIDTIASRAGTVVELPAHKVRGSNADGGVRALAAGDAPKAVTDGKPAASSSDAGKKQAPQAPAAAAASLFSHVGPALFFFPLLRGILTGKPHGAAAGGDTASVFGTSSDSLPDDIHAALNAMETFTLAQAPKFLSDASAAPLLAQALRALAVFVESIRVHAAAEPMIRSLLALAWLCRKHADVGVRRAVLSCFAACIAGIYSNRLTPLDSVLQRLAHSSLVGVPESSPRAATAGAGTAAGTTGSKPASGSAVLIVEIDGGDAAASPAAQARAGTAEPSSSAPISSPSSSSTMGELLSVAARMAAAEDASSVLGAAGKVGAPLAASGRGPLNRVTGHAPRDMHSGRSATDALMASDAVQSLRALPVAAAAALASSRAKKTAGGAAAAGAGGDDLHDCHAQVAIRALARQAATASGRATAVALAPGAAGSTPSGDAGPRMIWEDVLDVVSHLQEVQASDPDDGCRGMARAMAGNAIIHELALGPVDVMEALMDAGGGAE